MCVGSGAGDGGVVMVEGVANLPCAGHTVK